MAKKETNVNRWVDDRLAALDAADTWEPDAVRGLSRLRARQRAAYRHRIEWIVASFAGAAACILLLVFSSPGACARSRSCASDPARPAATATVQPMAGTAPETAPAPPALEAARPKTAAAPTPAKPVRTTAVNFKETGSPTAPIVCEVYTDYECPHCAVLYKETIPLLLDQYVRTGKVRLVHRDFPLMQHQYSRLAARYANAAGALGQYDLVVNQLFQTQAIWGPDGSVDAQVMQVLPPGTMQKVRDLVHNSEDASIDADVVMATNDRINQTPTLIVVSKGKRQAIAGVPQFAMLKSYLDQLLSSR